MKAAPKTFTYARKLYKLTALLAICVMVFGSFIYTKQALTNPDFGESFGLKATQTEALMKTMESDFRMCSERCGVDKRFMQSLVFPELMRYNLLRDGVEAESLRTLYVQFGREYADFSVGPFQMKPSFAELVEIKSAERLSPSVIEDLQLGYGSLREEAMRAERIERLLDREWQMIYLTAFVCICNELYGKMNFNSPTEKLQWYATVYNAGFDRKADYIQRKTDEANFYLSENMPGKKFKYAAIAAWFYLKDGN